MVVFTFMLISKTIHGFRLNDVHKNDHQYLLGVAKEPDGSDGLRGKSGFLK